MSADLPVPNFPLKFGRFQLLDRLAVGGMAEIFKAKMTGAAGFEKIVVIKRILPHLAADAQFVDMFIDEAKLTVHLVHPKIVQVLEFGEVEGQYYIALEYVEGLDCLALLRACAHKRLRVPAVLAAHIGAEVLDALDYAHRAADPEGRLLGIVHRDISPSNVFLSRRGDIKLGDFGIAHATERQSKTQAGTLKGKYGYMSPEQVVGAKLDGRSDIFAVGIVLSEMLMGRRLFTSPNDLDVLLMVRDVKLERLHKYGTDMPAPLREIVLRALRRSPAERWQAAGAFRDALWDWLFQNGTRVGPSEVGAFLRSLYVEGTADSEQPEVRIGTMAGQSTRAAALQAELARRQNAQAVAMAAPPERGRKGPKPAPGPVPPAVGDARASPSVPSPAVTPADWFSEMQIPDAAGSQPLIVAPGGASLSVGPAEVAAPPAADELEALIEPASAPHVVDGSQFELELGAAGDPAAIEGLEVDVQITPAPATEPTTPTEETTPASLAEAFQVLESTPPQLEDLMTTGRQTVASEVDRAFAQIGADDATPVEAPIVRERSAPARVEPEVAPPTEEGDLAEVSVTRVFSRLAVCREIGMLRVECGGAVKDIYLAGGAPEYVTSNLARELLGEYLVAQGVITSGELSMALAMMPRFGGKLGDTLVGLSLLRPLDVFRHLTRQVRDKLIDVFTWSRGRWLYWKGRVNNREAFPLGLDALEIIGAGVLSIPAEFLCARYQALNERTPRGRPGLLMDPDAFRVGPMPRELLARLDGRKTLGEWIRLYTGEQELSAFYRTLYLLIETDLATLE